MDLSLGIQATTEWRPQSAQKAPAVAREWNTIPRGLWLHLTKQRVLKWLAQK